MRSLGLGLLFALLAPQETTPEDLAARLAQKLREGPWSLELLDECEGIVESARLRRETILSAWDRAKPEGDNPRFLLFRARMARPMSCPLDLAAALEDLIRRFPDDPPILFHTGKARLETGRYSGARAALEALLEKDPGADRRPALHLWLAECCARSGSPELAREQLRRAEEVQDPLFLGAFASRLGLKEDAIRLFGKVLREEAQAGRAPTLRIRPAPGQTPEAALAELDPEEALAELDPDGRRIGMAPALHRLAAIEAYDREGKRWGVLRAGIGILEDPEARPPVQTRAKRLIAGACRGLGEGDWGKLGGLLIAPVPPALSREAKALREDLASDDPQLRVAARSRLRKIGVRALPVLLEMRDAADLDLRSSVRELIRDILTAPERP
jgi:tetratricopeptide (TPR) repeat protein